jgi:hypothetical protein|tara:strand:- start:974 stop:1231 length:258 start_codon:yes stop_codon:yes gene_type:complete
LPTYPVINKETGEKKELSMTMKAYDTWRKENPGWDKDWGAGVAAIGEVGDMFAKGEANSSGWNEVLDKASRQPGATVRKNRDYSF